MLPLLSGLLSAAGSIFGGLFQTKQAKMEAISTGITSVADMMKSTNHSDAEIATAVAQVVASEAQSDSFLARNWRPFLMVFLIAMIVSFWFGYTPPHLNDNMSPMMEEIFGMLKIGLGGYIPCRSVDKWVSAAYKSKLFEQILNKLAK